MWLVQKSKRKPICKPNYDPSYYRRMSLKFLRLLNRFDSGVRRKDALVEE